MQPQQIYPTAPPSVNDQPIATPAPTTTDQLIAQENARIYVFEHGPPVSPKQHRVFSFIGGHKQTLAIGAVAFILITSGGAFAFSKLLAFTKAPQVQQASTVTGNTKTSSATGGTTTADEADAETESTSEEQPSDESEESEYYDDEMYSEEEEYGEETYTESEEEALLNEDDAEPTEDSAANEPIATPAPTPTPAVPAPTLSHKFTIASWNTNDDNDRVVGDQVKTIMASTQLLGLQEVQDNSQRASISSKVICSSCAYAGYMASYNSSTASASSYPIIWNKSSFSQIGNGSSRKMSDSRDDARYATWVKLQSKVNSKQLYVINTHFVGGVETNGKPRTDASLLNRYKTHMTNLVALINELKTANIPIYIVGTFNVNYRYDHTVKTSYFPYASLGAIGVRSNWDMMNLSGIPTNAGTQGSGNRLIDYVFTWQRSDVSSNSIAISSSRYGSDQSVVFYTSTIK